MNPSSPPAEPKDPGKTGKKGDAGDELEIDLRDGATEPVVMTAAERIRQETREATRRALLEAGLNLTIEAGGEIPSIEAVCRQAGYTRGAFYVYFEDREQFVNELLDWLLSDIIGAVFETPAEGAASLQEIVTRFDSGLATGDLPGVEANVRAGYLAVLREVRPGTKVRERHAELMVEVHNRLVQRVQDGQGSDVLRGDVAAEHVAMLLLLTAVGAIMWNGVGVLKDGHELGNALLSLVEAPAGAGVSGAATKGAD